MARSSATAIDRDHSRGPGPWNVLQSQHLDTGSIDNSDVALIRMQIYGNLANNGGSAIATERHSGRVITIEFLSSPTACTCMPCGRTDRDGL